MREADGDGINVIIEDYCMAVLNAQSEEEIEVIEQKLIFTLQDLGLSEDEINTFLTQLNEKLNEKMTMDENFEVHTGVGVTQISSNQSSILMGGAGIAISAFIAVLALKKINLKKGKNQNHFKK